MIYPIEDDLDDFADVAEPEPSWADCPLLRRADMLGVIEKRGNLDGRAVNMFLNCFAVRITCTRSDYFRTLCTTVRNEGRVFEIEDIEI